MTLAETRAVVGLEAPVLDVPADAFVQLDVKGAACLLSG